MIDGNLAPIFIAFFVAFNVPLGVYWLYKRRTREEGGTEPSADESA